jgi:hypothetical protein
VHGCRSCRRVDLTDLRWRHRLASAGRGEQRPCSSPSRTGSAGGPMRSDARSLRPLHVAQARHHRGGPLVPAETRRRHDPAVRGSYTVPFASHFRWSRPVAEADGYAYEPRHPVADPLDHHTGLGTGELRTAPVGLGSSRPPTPLDAELMDVVVEPRRLDGPMVAAHEQVSLGEPGLAGEGWLARVSLADLVEYRLAAVKVSAPTSSRFWSAREMHV